jgi:hypothetical protein
VIAGIAGRLPVDPRLNPDSAAHVAEAAKSLIENVCGTDIQHAAL